MTGTGEIEGIDVDLHDASELTPVVAALAALAQSPWIRGVADIRGHETDRIAALATELNSMGGSVSKSRTACGSPRKLLRGGRFRSYHDHRMATAGAVLALRIRGVTVEDIGTTAKTLPDFTGLWTAMLGGHAGWS